MSIKTEEMINKYNLRYKLYDKRIIFTKFFRELKAINL